MGDHPALEGEGRRPLQLLALERDRQVMGVWPMPVPPEARAKAEQSTEAAQGGRDACGHPVQA